MRKQIQVMFGFKPGEEESLTAFLKRMDGIGQLDMLKVTRLLALALDEIEKLELGKDTKPGV